MGEGKVVELIDDMPEFSVVTLQKFSAGGDIEKEVPDLETCTHGGLDRFDQFGFGAGYAYPCAQLITPPPRFHNYFCNCSNGGKGFSSETFGLNRKQIFGRANFGSSMSLGNSEPHRSQTFPFRRQLPE